MFKSNRIKYISLLLFFLIFFFMNCLCPYLSDDWHFLFVWEYFDPLPTTHRIETFQDIIISMQNYYDRSGGRVIPHFFAYCCMTQSKWLFNILNSFMGCALFYLIYKIGLLEIKKKSPLQFLLAVLLSFGFIPSFGDNMLWLSGAVNYLWSGVFLLLCICWLLSRWETAKLWEFLLVIPLFMLSAATNEVTGGMLVICLLLNTIIAKDKRLVRCIVLLTLMIPSICFVVLAEGNQVRRHTIEQIDKPSIFELLKMSFFYVRTAITDQYFISIVILTAFFFSVLIHENWKIILKRNLVALVGFSGIAALGALGFYTSRPKFFGGILLITAAYASLLWIYEKYQLQKNEREFWISLLRSLLLAVACVLIFVILELIATEVVLAIIGVTIIMIFTLALGFQFKKICNHLVLSDKDSNLLNKIVAFLPQAMIITCILVLSLSYFIKIGLYMQWSKKYKICQDTLTSYIETGDLEGANSHTKVWDTIINGFIPMESIMVPNYYLVEWMALSHGQNVTEFVEKYAIRSSSESLIE